MRSRGFLLTWSLAFLISLPVSAENAAKETDTIRVSWSDSRIEDALQAVQEHGGRLPVLCDSYPLDSNRGSRKEAAGTPEQVQQFAASVHFGVNAA